MFNNTTFPINTLQVIAFGEQASNTVAAGKVKPYTEQDQGEALTVKSGPALTAGAITSSTLINCTDSLISLVHQSTTVHLLMIFLAPLLGPHRRISSSWY